MIGHEKSKVSNISFDFDIWVHIGGKMCVATTWALKGLDPQSFQD